MCVCVDMLRIMVVKHKLNEKKKWKSRRLQMIYDYFRSSSSISICFASVTYKAQLDIHTESDAVNEMCSENP